MVNEPPIKLRSESEAADLYGFYRTAEGRQFLRSLYRRYRARIGMGDWKIATIIADPSTESGIDEVEITTSALKRWRGISGGTQEVRGQFQAELWKDASKTARVLSRLEREMMNIPETKEILDDQAATVHKWDVGNALSLFFNGSPKRDDDISGIAQVFFGPPRLFRTPFRNQKGGESNSYTYYERPDGADFLIFHKLVFDGLGDSEITTTQHWSGYAIPHNGDQLARFMISHENPLDRKIEIVGLAQFVDQSINSPEVILARVAHLVTLTSFYRGDAAETGHILYISTENRFIQKYMASILWDIVL